MPSIKSEISWSDFQKLDIRVGTVERAEAFLEARKPAIKLWINFGSEIGVRKTSAQITDHYLPDDLVGLQVLAVLNFAPKQIGPFMSECLVLGAIEEDGSVVLLGLNITVTNGLSVG
jgi:tRNA-binding protein|tara:strand:+ start:237 stop:587 length:351 start_codon:yes stop_codon:yes gene_type:complete